MFDHALRQAGNATMARYTPITTSGSVSGSGSGSRSVSSIPGPSSSASSASSSALSLPLRTESHLPMPPRPTEIILDFSAPGSQQAKRPLTRRGHVKSRLGCFTCKKRRVKCDEQHPVCAQCTRLKLSCTYPPGARRLAEQQMLEAVLHSKLIQRSIGSSLSLDHLRFYHHFLTKAHPKVPLHERPAWEHCTAMSHEFDYLAHALLGLAASHLTVHTSADYATEALHHRTTAIRLVNKRLSSPVESGAEGDALLAALCCLTGQSSLVTDSMSEYLVMSRGTYLVTYTIVIPFNDSVFQMVHNTSHRSGLASLVQDQEKDLDVIADFKESVESLASICTRKHELQFQAGLHQSITALPTSSVEAVTAFVDLFIMPSRFENADFLDFMREDNYAGHLLTAHLFLLDYLLGQTSIPKSRIPEFGGRKKIVLTWIRRLANRLPSTHKSFGDFLLRLCDIFDKCDARYLFFP